MRRARPSARSYRPKPKRWIAVLLSMASTGLGHVYYGHTGRGLIWGVLPMAWTALVTIAMRPIGAALGYRGFLTAMYVPLIVPWALAIASVASTPEKMRRAVSPMLVVAVGVGMFLAGRTLAAGLRAFSVEAFKIPSGSMIPTLLVGDHLFIDKSVYRTRAPHRGEIIVFEYPEDREQHFIKRILAVPGDVLEVSGGHPTINGWEVPSCKVGTYTYRDLDGTTAHSGDLLVEYLGDEAYLTFFDRNAAGEDHYGPFVVGAGEYWVLGDNRNNAHDSRTWRGGRGGGVAMDLVTGRAVFAYFNWHGNRLVGWRVGLDIGKARLPPEMSALEPALDRCLRNHPTLAQSTPPGPPSAPRLLTPQ